MVIRKKPIIEAKKKLEEVYVNLWDPHYPPLLSKKTYIAILLDKKTRKSCVIYLHSKDEFVDVFITWVPKVEIEYNKLGKVLQADGGGEFISTKLKDFCKKKALQLSMLCPIYIKRTV